MDKVRAKFTVSSITAYPNSTDATIKLLPVYDASNTEDVSFSKYTPSGEISLYVSNPPAAAFFTLGKKVYVDFTPVEV